jgi:DNA-binding MarR family transcriptional regulator
MASDIQQEPNTNQIARLLQDFLQLQIKIKASLPKELAQIRSQIDELNPGGKSERRASYALFYSISHNLYQKNSLTMGELSDYLSVPLSTATGMVDWMVDNGYAQRLPDLEDRRVVRVALTDKGRKLHEMIENDMGQRFEQILSCLTAEERSILFIIIGKMFSAFKELKG